MSGEHPLKTEILSTARDIGFALVRVTDARPLDERIYLDAAIEEGRIAEMRWLARNPSARCDPAILLPGARSVICCALAYGEQGFPSSEFRVPSPERIARFARGADYHVVVKKKLRELWSFIKERAPHARGKLCVDTSPILEKALAQRAGLGWIGKHTVLVNRDIGSWFVLGEIITDLEVEPDAPVADGCGACRKCLGACPVGALVGERTLDARKCISYLTIEAPRTDLSHHASRDTLHGCSYGCDICQEACPYNADQQLGVALDAQKR
jgi:epoxyqueuosine reductase